MYAKLTSAIAALSLIVFSQFALSDEYAEARKIFEDAGQSAGFFQNSYGYALFPTIGKGGFGVGGAHGSGQVYVGGSVVGKTSMTQLTIGIQLGGQAYSQIIFFENKKAFDDFTSGNFEFSAQATAVAITASAGAQTTTGGGNSAGASGGKHDASTVSAGYQNGMAIFTVAKGGLMYEASLGGQKYSYEAE